jgi:hypothetical protein
MEAISISEALANFYETTQCNISDGCNLNFTSLTALQYSSHPTYCDMSSLDSVSIVTRQVLLRDSGFVPLLW